MSLTVRVIAPDKTVWDAEAEEIILPSTTGQLGILGGHAPLMTALDIGVMRVRPEKEWVAIAVMGGFAEVDNDEVTILVRGAEQGSNIDQDEARSAFEAAQTAVNTVSADDRRASLQAKQELRRARARLQAAGGAV
ncbi:ATP synthase F1 subunit epsilon [Leptolyngbya iicbica]|uniref:ATP synthase epsilon chain n=2 Tax=Cyanophyceae TaxID=3028117 RepID=A0A4Q7EGF1_9CYAN|nr:ATP synthase F1 subunit epsilon [Leptolyngbya sp. LK]RZM82415.1 F0F1 ATP synthase subunit epsilon [Leptolyngbya sp. LK]